MKRPPTRGLAPADVRREALRRLQARSRAAGVEDLALAEWLVDVARTSTVDQEGREARRDFRALCTALQAAEKRAAMGAPDTWGGELRRFFAACPGALKWLRRVSEDPAVTEWRAPSEWEPRRRLVHWLGLSDMPWRSDNRTADYALVVLAVLSDDVTVNPADTFTDVHKRAKRGVRIELERIEQERARYVSAVRGGTRTGG